MIVSQKSTRQIDQAIATEYSIYSVIAARLHVHPLRGGGLYQFLEEIAGLRLDRGTP